MSRANEPLERIGAGVSQIINIHPTKVECSLVRRAWQVAGIQAYPVKTDA